MCTLLVCINSQMADFIEMLTKRKHIKISTFHLSLTRNFVGINEKKFSLSLSTFLKGPWLHHICEVY